MHVRDLRLVIFGSTIKNTPCIRYWEYFIYD